jgi:hypothetical protein
MQLRREKVNSRVAEGWKCIDSIDCDNFDVVKCLFLLGEMDVRISNAKSGIKKLL